MIINHVDNNALFSKTIDRSNCKPLMNKVHECFQLFKKVNDPETKDALYLAVSEAVELAEDNAFDRAAELQAAITTDELTIHCRPYDPHKTTEYTAAAREYINSMTEDELIEHGHNEFNGKDQMLAALHAIDLLAAHDEEEARAAYHDFLDNNLSGMSFEFEE